MQHTEALKLVLTLVLVLFFRSSVLPAAASGESGAELLWAEKTLQLRFAC